MGCHICEQGGGPLDERRDLLFTFSDAADQQLDRLALDAVNLGRKLAWPTARAAAALSELKGWKNHGFATAHDFAREKLGRSAGWLRLHARIGRAGLKYPELAAALSGSDGREPLNGVAADWISRVALGPSIGGWIGFARTHTVRQVKDAVQAFQEQGPGVPFSDPETLPLPTRDDWEEPDPDLSRRVRLELPLCPAAREGFEVALELFRAGDGGPATVTSFVEACCADFESGRPGPRPDPLPVGIFPGKGATRAQHERAWALRRKPAGPSDEPLHSLFSEVRQKLETAGELIDRAGEGDGFQVGRSLIALAGLEKDLRRILGRLFSKLQFHGAWRTLGYMDLEQYAEERLGLAASSARELLQVARFAQAHPVLGEKYDRGEIHTRSAHLLLRALGPAADDSLLERWLGEVQGCTVKRLEDELHFRRRRRALGDAGADFPPGDEAWRASISRPVGYYKAQISACLKAAADQPVAGPLVSLTLPVNLAQRFLGVLQVAQETVNTHYGEPGPAELHLERRFGPQRTFAAYRVVGADSAAFLLVMAQFAEQYDVAEKRRDGRRGPLAERDGYRCTAPACTVRRFLEVHHLEYLSQGGSLDDPKNQTLLCRVHHQEGEHIGRIKVGGQAPLDLDFRLGPPERGEWFRNERPRGQA